MNNSLLRILKKEAPELYATLEYPLLATTEQIFGLLEKELHHRLDSLQRDAENISFQGPEYANKMIEEALKIQVDSLRVDVKNYVRRWTHIVALGEK